MNFPSAPNIRPKQRGTHCVIHATTARSRTGHTLCDTPPPHRRLVTKQDTLCDTQCEREKACSVSSYVSGHNIMVQASSPQHGSNFRELA